MEGRKCRVVTGKELKGEKEGITEKNKSEI